MARMTQLQQFFAPPAARARRAPTATAAPATSTTAFATALQSAGGTASLTPAAPAGTAGQAIVNLVSQEVGVAEQPPGSNDSPRIAQFRQATAGSGVGPWCAYFTSWAAREAGVPLGDNGQGFGRVDDVYAWAQKSRQGDPEHRRRRQAAAGRPDRLGRAHRRRRVRRRRRHDQHDRGQLLRSGLQALLRPGRAARDRLRAPRLVLACSRCVEGAPQGRLFCVRSRHGGSGDQGAAARAAPARARRSTSGPRRPTSRPRSSRTSAAPSARTTCARSSPNVRAPKRG